MLIALDSYSYHSSNAEGVLTAYVQVNQQIGKPVAVVVQIPGAIAGLIEHGDESGSRQAGADPHLTR